MDTLHDRLADLADDAPTGGVPAAELWARGKRAHRLRVAGFAAALLVVGAVGTGIGARVASGDRPDPEPVGTVGLTLPIEYPVGEELPDLGETPGPLAAIWVAPNAGGGAPEAVGLVAGTGTFGTLPIDVRVGKDEPANPGVALSPDGRRIAYRNLEYDVVIHDLVSGEKELPTIEDSRRLVPYGWIDATHLYGIASLPTGGWRDTYGWAWELGTGPRLVNLEAYPGHPYLGFGWPYAGTDLMVVPGEDACASTPRALEVTDDPYGEAFDLPVLCDVLGVIDSAILLGHWNSEHFAGESDDPQYASGTVVALDSEGADRPYVDPALRGPGADQAFDDPALRRVVVNAGAPHRVTFATDLIGEALESAGGAS